MKKTENYAYNEAYLQGFRDALNEYDDALAAVTEWFDSPEYKVALALNEFKVSIKKELRR